MSTQTLIYDVFLSCSLTEAAVGDLVQRALQGAGLDVFNATRIEKGESFQETLWRALAESSAVVVVVHPRQSLSSSVSVEVGAAMAWHKPVYVLLAESGEARLPVNLAEFPQYPVSRIDDLVQAIAHGSKPLSDEERSALMSVYAEMGVPVDKLLLKPAALDNLARSHFKLTGIQIAGERLVQELVRLRKRGDLPRLRR